MKTIPVLMRLTHYSMLQNSFKVAVSFRAAKRRKIKQIYVVLPTIKGLVTKDVFAEIKCHQIHSLKFN